MTSPNPPTATPHETDEALVVGLGRGDEGALRILHQRYAALVFTVAARLLDSGAAEEVVQDVFVTLWKKHATFDPDRGTFKAWLVQIARRRALNELRRKQGRGVHSDHRLDALADDSVEEPDEAQWLAHRRAVIRAAVDALPTSQRQALSLAFFDELTHEQIADALKTPIGTTKTRIRLALKRLGPALLLVLAAAVVVFVNRRRQERDARNVEALRMVTASDVVPLRLSAAPGAPDEAHGAFRTRPGASVAVLTTSHLPAPPEGEGYLAWAHGQGGWRALGPVEPAGDGRSLLVVTLARGGPTFDELRVTREALPPGKTPSGVLMLGAVGPP